MISCKNIIVSILFFSHLLVGQVYAQKDTVLNVYQNQTEIRASKSITLKDGFFIPAGKNVRLFIGPDAESWPGSIWAGSMDQNYIRTRVFKKSNVNDKNIDSARSVAEVNQTVQYFDGLGRPLQAITVQGSPSFKDVVQPVVYDAFGRETIKYLPYTTSLGVSNGSYKASAVNEQISFYNAPPAGVKAISNSAYSESRFEASPLNRVLEQGAPGVSWQLAAGYTQKASYGANVLNEVQLWNVTANGATAAGFYAAGTLNKTTNRDENVAVNQKAGSVEEYKDFQGQVILKRVWKTETIKLSTYYVYDDFGNLRYVIPPAVTVTNFTEQAGVFDQFIYGYHYDGRKRLTRKKIPGKGWESMAYNRLDQLVFSQDSVQRSQGKWSFNKYDALGRLVITGAYAETSTRAGLQSKLDTLKLNWEIKNNIGLGYSNFSLPKTASETDYLMVNYYDGYDFPGNTFGPANPAAGQMGNERVKGLQTGSKVRVLGGQSFLLSVNYYDAEGRMVQSKSENHLKGTDVLNNTYNFAGELLSSSRVNLVGGVTTTIANRYAYDHMGRRTMTFEKINAGVEVALNKQDYNELSQLWKKSLHSTDNGSSFLQTTELAYNERGWLKSNISNQFKFELQYQDGSLAQYNGNISAQKWGMGGTNYPNQFNYSYDAMNRLLNASSIGVVMSEVLSYDDMGNISSLNRDSKGISAYSYIGNRLNKVTGASLATDAYQYDLNGNVIFDGRNKVSLTYNQLNLPATATKADLDLSYTYRADGIKLQKNNSGVVRNYIDGIEYIGNTVDVIHTEEGLARNNAGTFSYEYNLSDHLGNVRYSFRKGVNNAIERIQSDDYYAFGQRKSSGAPVSLVNKYLYNGKEIQDELGGQYDYGARFYDPVIGRWNVVDPLAELDRKTSPYAYVFNNPLRFIDPTGMKGEDWYKSYETGSLVWKDGSGQQDGYKHIAETAVVRGASGEGDVNLNANGSATNAQTGETVTASLSGKTNIIAKGEVEFELGKTGKGLVDGMSTGVGTLQGITMTMSSEARGLSNVTKVLEGAGTVLGVVSALNDANEIYNKGMSNATVADWSKLGVSVGQLALKSNPWTIGLGLAYGVADMTGYNPIDLVYDRVKK